MANTRTITLDGERITVTQHGEDDYSIAFDVADFSVRGSFLDVVKTFAEWQQATLDEPVVSFEWEGIDISNPWLDDSFRFPIDDEGASATYGVVNIFQYIVDATALLNPDDDRRE